MLARFGTHANKEKIYYHKCVKSLSSEENTHRQTHLDPRPQTRHVKRKRLLGGLCDDYQGHFSPLTACQSYERSETVELVYRGNCEKTGLLLLGRHGTFSVYSGRAMGAQTCQGGRVIIYDLEKKIY